jgi:dipeptidyl aminopeptidase/acylaminoacyl peptidase
MVFDDEKMIAGFQFVPTEIEYKYEPPDYADLESFDEVNVTVGTGLWMLPGTLTIPKGSGLFPVVILVHGSGPNDRDESIGPNKPFKDLAWGLASKGIAVLRYEKRTKEYPEQSAALTNLTVQEEVIDDVFAAIDVLNTTERIDQERMFVLGHSLGGMLGPRVTEQDDRLAGLIILAGPTRNLEDLFLEQTTYLANLDGEIDENEGIQIANIQEQVEKVKELNISEGEFILGVPKAYWQDLAKYNPVETAENLSIPVLILQGERDYQVTIDGDFSKWNESLYTNDNVTLKTYELLNHLFISGSGPPTNAEYLVEGHVEEEVIDDISEWIKNH